MNTAAQPDCSHSDSDACGRFYAHPEPLDYEFCYQPKGHDAPCVFEPRRREADDARVSESSLSRTFEAIRGAIYLYETGEIDYATLIRSLRESVLSLERRATSAVRTTADDHAAFFRGVRGKVPLLSWHREFARCPGCEHATVGLSEPYGINHAEGCTAVASLSGGANGF